MIARRTRPVDDFMVAAIANNRSATTFEGARENARKRCEFVATRFPILFSDRPVASRLRERGPIRGEGTNAQHQCIRLAAGKLA
jgi:hypothetical protein